MKIKKIWDWLKGVKGKKSQHESGRTGLLFAIICLIVSLILMGSGFLSGIDDYLSAAIFQYSYDEPKLEHKILVIKKDQATSELIGQNPGREEFESIFSLLGKGQTIKRENVRPRSFSFITMKIGLIKELKLPVIRNSMLDLQGVTRKIATRLYKEGGQTSLFSFESRLFTPISASLLSTLTGVSGDLVYTTLGLNIKDDELGYIDIKRTKPAKPLSVQEKEEFELKNREKAQKLMKRWQRLFMNILSSHLSVDVRLFPKSMNSAAKLLLQIDLVAELEGLPPEYYVEPASVIAFDFILQGSKDVQNDEKLAKTIARSESQIVLAAHTKTEEEYSIDDDKYQLAKGQQMLGHFTKNKLLTRYILPSEKFLRGKAKVGMINMAIGNKGYVTEVPLFSIVPARKKLIPSFSLLTAMLAKDAEKKDGKKQNSYVEAMYRQLDKIYPSVASGTFKGPFRILDQIIPVNSHGRMYLKFYGSTRKNRFRKAAFRSVSFYECFSKELLEKYIQQVKPEKARKLKNANDKTLQYGSNKGRKICMIGPFEMSDFDFYPTPMSMRTPYTVQNEPLMGVEIHANAVSNILNQDYLKHPNYWQIIIILVFSTLLLGILLDFMAPLPGALLTVVFAGGITWFASYSYHQLGQVFHFSSMLISYPAIWCSATVTNYLRQRARAQKTKNMFSRFVSKDVVQYMLENPELVKPGGQKVELSIFFSDIAGFTSISEALSPEDLVVLLNEYLGAMTDLIFEYGGTLDKFIGDAVMAFWNYPKEQSDHAARACLCALAMQRKIEELQLDWAKRGLPRVAARAGLNSADVVVGYMGSIKAQMNFTCMGDGVNLAARLEGANKEYGTLLMVSEATYLKAKDVITVRFLDFLTVKGKKEPVKVYQLVSEKGNEPPEWFQLVELYDKGIKLHLERKWDEAIQTFEELLARWPDDGPSETYIKRCREYKLNPPPENWDGRYILTHK
ncbi:MAG: CHASE2 domain-containing protein [Candidatus Rifleibacteriota bacterium]